MYTMYRSDKWQVGQMTHFMYRSDIWQVGQMAGRTNDAFCTGRTNGRLDKRRGWTNVGSDKRRSDKRRTDKRRSQKSRVINI